MISSTALFSMSSTNLREARLPARAPSAYKQFATKFGQKTLDAIAAVK